MDKKINCNVMTLNGTVYKGEVDFAAIPASDGEIGFLYNHAPIIAELGSGELKLVNGQESIYLAIEGGFAELKENSLNIFAENAYKKDELKTDEIKVDIDNLKARIKSERPGSDKRSEIDKEINNLKMKLKTAAR